MFMLFAKESPKVLFNEMQYSDLKKITDAFKMSHITGNHRDRYNHYHFQKPNPIRED